MSNSAEHTNTPTQKIDTIVTNWIREVKLQASQQPVPTSSYGYGEGGAGYDAYATYYNGNELITVTIVRFVSHVI